MNRNILLILSLAATTAYAQLDNTVEVTNEVRPAIKDANKIDVFPTALATQARPTTVQYLQQVLPLTQFAVEPLRDYTSEAVLKGNKRGYVHLGGGSHKQVDAMAAYRLDMTDADALALDLSLKGHNGNSPTSGDIHEGAIRMYRNRAGARYDHTFDNGIDLYAKGELENHAFNYLHTVYQPQGPTDKQHNVLGSVSAGMMPCDLGNLTLQAEMGMDIFRQQHLTNFSDKYGETILRGDMNGRYAFGDEHLAEVGVEFFKSDYKMAGIDGITHFHFTPHYIYNGDNLRLQLGVVAGSDGDVAPDVRAAYRITPRSEVYANAIGYDRDNDLRRLTSIHPFFVFDSTTPFTLDAEFHKIDACIGYRFGNMHFMDDGRLSGDINAGYDLADGCPTIDDVSLMNDTRGLWVAWTTFCETKRFYINADFTYSYRDRVKVELKNQFNAWKYRNPQTGDWTPGHYLNPTLDLHWNVDVRIVGSLFAGASCEMKYYDCPDPLPQCDNQWTYERPNTCNLGASLRYTVPVDTPLSIFVKGDNLLSQKKIHYFNYHNIGANVLAGVALSF